MKETKNVKYSSMHKLVTGVIADEGKIFGLIVDSIEQGKKILVTYFNQNSLIIAKDNPTFRKLLLEKYVLFSDGIGMYYFQKFLNMRCQLFNATDLFCKILGWIIETKREIVIVGGNIAQEKVVDFCKGKGIRLNKYFNGYEDLNKFDRIIREIREIRSPIVILGIGTPKQEFLAEKISKEIEHSCVLCVGRFFEYFTGYEKRAPKLYRRIGMEWLYRLITKPKYYFRRYVFGIPIFFLTMLRIKIQFWKISISLK